MSEAGLHKQIANRLLEPWFNIRVILSGTEFENFFALRAHKDAQPEFQALANAMLVEYNKSVPRTLKEGDWHIPFGDHIDEDRLKQLPTTSVASVFAKADFLTGLKIMIAVARCARVSYYNFEGKDDYSKDIDICTKLFGSTPRHLSPAEHVAMAAPDGLFHGNFRGWIQFRKFFPDENLRDPRVSTPTA
jgi:thymidylate synthase ThyX